MKFQYVFICLFFSMTGYGQADTLVNLIQGDTNITIIHGDIVTTIFRGDTNTSVISGKMLIPVKYTYNYDELKYFTIDIEEDFFKLRRSTDRYYTLGMEIGYDWHAGDRAFNGRLWQRIVPKSTDAFIGVGIGNAIYTPADLTKDSLDEFDRPYSGFTYLYLKSIINDLYEGKRLTFKMKIGCLGECSRSDSIQTKFHRLTNTISGEEFSKIPQGWDSQIASSLGVNINIKYEQSLVEFSRLIDLTPYVEGNVGTISNNIGIGFLFRMGVFNDFFSNEIGARLSEDQISYLQKDFSKYRKRTIYWHNLRRKFRLFYFFRAGLVGVVDNSFIQGNIGKRKKNRRENRHIIHADELERFYLKGEVGVTFAFKNFQITWSQLFKTKEYRNSENLHWGRITLNVPIGRRCKIKNVKNSKISHKIDPYQDSL